MASREENERQLEIAKELASAGDWPGAAGLVKDIASSLLESPFKESESKWAEGDLPSGMIEERMLSREEQGRRFEEAVGRYMSTTAREGREEQGRRHEEEIGRYMSTKEERVPPWLVDLDRYMTGGRAFDVRTGGARTPSMKKAVETGIEELGLILGFASDFMVPFESPALERSVSAAGDIRPWLAEMGEQDIEAMETLAGEPEVGSDRGVTQTLLELPTDRPALIHEKMISKFPSLKSGAVDSGIHRGLMMTLYQNGGRPLVADDLEQDALDFLRDKGNREILNEYDKAGLFAAPRVGDETRDEFREMLEETGRTGLPDTRSREERLEFPSF